MTNPLDPAAGDQPKAAGDPGQHPPVNPMIRDSMLPDGTPAPPSPYTERHPVHGYPMAPEGYRPPVQPATQHHSRFAPPPATPQQPPAPTNQPAVPPAPPAPQAQAREPRPEESAHPQAFAAPTGAPNAASPAAGRPTVARQAPPSTPGAQQPVAHQPGPPAPGAQRPGPPAPGAYPPPQGAPQQRAPQQGAPQQFGPPQQRPQQPSGQRPGAQQPAFLQGQPPVPRQQAPQAPAAPRQAPQLGAAATPNFAQGGGVGGPTGAQFAAGDDEPPRKKLSTAAKVMLTVASFAVLVLVMALPTIIANTAARDITASLTIPVVPEDAPTPGPDETYDWEPTEPEPTDPPAVPTTEPVEQVTGEDFLAENTFATNFQPEKSDDGAYGEAATELAAEYGLTINWDIKTIADIGCGTLTDAELQGVVAAVCPTDITQIFVNTYRDDFMILYQDLFFISAIKHEIGHVQITQICGVAYPPVADVPEAVTSSYAVLYFGADDAALNNGTPPEYQTTSETEAQASLIYEGKCNG